MLLPPSFPSYLRLAIKPEDFSLFKIVFVAAQSVFYKGDFSKNHVHKPWTAKVLNGIISFPFSRINYFETLQCRRTNHLREKNKYQKVNHRTGKLMVQQLNITKLESFSEIHN